ncbi:DUF6284 family protein [Streptomyces sp. NBC_00555]|uniref:DUF6284 family protein n=1 Tax=Streptomyces sp. NBC_00555 TaxID=2903662 RepID=UPI002258235E|nr:DUF6284 family protein [Streptomyces sp. NBC_00555]MCX5014779.1 DUF6284 family protein [Streptomyces sp. NBC_00555]
MKHIVALHDAVTPWSDGLEPSDAELDAIEVEMPVISAEVELLDVRIALMDRAPNELDERRFRRAVHRLLDARRTVTAASTRASMLGSAS